MTALTISLFVALLGFITVGLIRLRRRVTNEQDKNSSIYQTELKAARSKETKLTSEITFIDETEGEETELTFRDLMDDEGCLDYGQMNY